MAAKQPSREPQMGEQVQMNANERCGWAKTELSIAYHDTEWGVPVHDDRLLFEFLVLEGAQAGLSWETILKKREPIAPLSTISIFAPSPPTMPERSRRCLANPGIVRNRLKIVSAVDKRPRSPGRTA